MNINGMILGCKKTRPTAARLATFLKAEYREDFVDLEPEKSYQYVFRYGNSYANLPQHRDGFVVFNSQRCIERVANKASARIEMVSNGINCPKVFLSGDLKKCRYPIIARPQHHFKGKNFYLIHDEKSAMKFLDNGYYLQEVIDKDREFRVFMFRNKFFEVNEKINRGNARNNLIRNAGNGWYFSWISYLTISEELRRICRNATELFEIDWAAIDCCIAKDGNPYIFEINSAPSLIDRKIQKLGEKIVEALEKHGFSIDDNSRNELSFDTTHFENLLRSLSRTTTPYSIANPESGTASGNRANSAFQLSELEPLEEDEEEEDYDEEIEEEDEVDF